MRKPALALLCTACLVTLSACSITGNQESDSSTSAGNTSKPVENNISAGKPVEKAAKAEPKNMEEQVQAWLAEGLIKPTDDPNIWQATKPLPRPKFTLKHEKPVYPEEGYVYNEAGAEAVASFWEDYYSYILNTGDISDIDTYCDSQADYCKYISETLNENLNSKSWYADYFSREPNVMGVGIPDNSILPGELSFKQTVKISDSYFFDGQENKLNKYQQKPLISYVNLSYLDNKWIVVFSEAEEQK